jgi:hypothetical protein
MGLGMADKSMVSYDIALYVCVMCSPRVGGNSGWVKHHACWPMAE